MIIEKLKILNDLEKVGKGSDFFRELSDLGFLQLELEQYVESEKNFLLCLKHFKKQLDRLGQAAVLGVLSTLYYKKEEYIKSIECYEKAYEIYNELQQIEEKIVCLKGIGNSYIKLNKLDEACETFLKCSAICSESNDLYNLLDCLGNLIQIHEKQEKFDIIFKLYKQSLDVFKELKDTQGMIVSYFNLGIIEKKFEKIDESLRHFKKGTNLAIDSNYSEFILKGLSYIGENLFYQGKIKEAKNEFIKALYLAKKVKAKNAILQLRILLKSIRLSENDIKQELEFYKESRKK